MSLKCGCNLGFVENCSINNRITILTKFSEILTLNLSITKEPFLLLGIGLSLNNNIGVIVEQIYKRHIDIGYALRCM